MTFKVIITHPSIDDDENTYYGITFLNPGKVKSGRLKYSPPDNKLKVTLTYDGNPIQVGEKFLASSKARMPDRIQHYGADQSIHIIDGGGQRNVNEYSLESYY